MLNKLIIAVGIAYIILGIAIGADLYEPSKFSIITSYLLTGTWMIYAIVLEERF